MAIIIHNVMAVTMALVGVVAVAVVMMLLFLELWPLLWFSLLQVL